MADTRTVEGDAPPVFTGDPDLDARLDEELSPQTKRWWKRAVGAIQTDFKVDVEELLRLSAEDD